MTLSEAIRLGAMLKPQGRMGIVHRGRTCVLGAALDAVGAIQPRRRRQHLRLYGIAKGHWPLLLELRCHPVSGEMDGTVEAICIDLNDNQPLDARADRGLGRDDRSGTRNLRARTDLSCDSRVNDADAVLRAGRDRDLITGCRETSPTYNGR